MGAKRTHQEYVDELRIKNPTVEVVEEYIDATTKIMHHCLIHDVYWKTLPSAMLYGSGCEMCRRDKFRQTHTWTNEKYLAELAKVAPDIIPLEKYRGKSVPILHRCNKHNIEWKSNPDSILHGHGCKLCGDEKIRAKNTMSYEEYVTRLKQINPNVKCIGGYTKATEKALHRCLIDGYEWYTDPENLLTGRGCPKCNKSHGEKEIAAWLKDHGIKYDEQKSFDDCRDKRPLPFDFYLPERNIVIEYDGAQHYRPIELFGGGEGYEKRIYHDKIKDEYCKENNLTILRIPYTKDVKKELNKFLLI